jgi:anti-sigma B factor antagonist
MDIIEERQDDITIIKITERLDTLSSAALEDKLLDTINKNQSKMIIDFSQLDFISSSGLRVLLTAGKQMKSAQGKLVLCSLKDHVKEVFDVAGFSMLFKMFSSQEESIKELK